MSSEEVILLHLKIDELRIRVWFGSVNNQTIILLLGTPFIDKYIREDFPFELRLSP